MVGRRAAGGSMTLLGDLAQATGSWRWRSWEEIVDGLPSDSAVRIESLVNGYRVPSEILDFAKPILSHMDLDIAPPGSIRASGEAVRDVQTSLESIAMETVAVAAVSAETDGTVGVIAPPHRHAELLDAAERAGLDLTTVAESGLGKVSLLRPDEAKGLEFDHVVVMEPAEISSGSDVGTSLLYVAVTRATRSLAVVHAMPLPASFTEAPDEPPSSDVSTDGTPPPAPLGLTEAIVIARVSRTAGDPALLAVGLEAAARELRRDDNGNGEDAAARALLRAVGADPDLLVKAGSPSD